MARAQEAEVMVPPPVIGFQQWRLVDETDYVEEYTVSFPSSVETQFPENNSILARAVLPKNRVGAVPVVLLLHYWGATSYQLEAEMAEAMALQGVATVRIPLPYHLERTPKGYRSGELTIQPDPEALRATMIQAVRDVRRTVDWIGTRPEFDVTRIGVTGTSLGAIVSTLAYGVEDRFAAGAFVLGGVDLAHILWNSSRVVAQRDQMRQEGITEESLREMLRDVEPSTYLGPADPRPTYVVQARYDTVIPARATEALLERIDEPQHLVLETGHYGGVLVQRRLIRSVAAFFESTFSGREFEAPDTFYSPTIRFGLSVDIETGLNVAASLDVWRLNPNNDAFASLMLTPRGPRGFVGGSLGKGVAIGVIVLPRKTTFGMVWNTVF